MPNFGYVAIDASGKQKRAVIEADNRERAIQAIKKEGLTVIEVKEQALSTGNFSLDFGGAPKVRDLSIFCRQFESMLQAGVTIISALNMLSEQTENKRLAAAIKEVQTSVEKGETLGNSMRAHKVFPSLLVSMVDAGEASGSLEVSMNRMATQFEKDAKTQALIKKAMIYPIVVALVAVAVVCVMLVFVIPSYMEMFADMGAEMPAITLAVVAMSDFLIAKWYLVLAGIAGIVIAFKAFKKTAYGEHILGKLGLILPLFGDLTIKSSSARFARTLSTLLASGISLVDGVEIVANIMGNVLVKEAMKDAREQIIQGVPLSQPLQTCGLFPPMVYHMTRIGEESGDVEGLLSRMADYYEDEVEMATQSLMAAMEPLIIIVLALVVGVLIGAVMAPMLAMYQSLDSL